MILLQIAQRLLERRGHARHFGQLGRRQCVDVLVERLARIEPALNSVDPRHQHRGEREIRIAGRVGEAHFDSLGLGRRRIHRDSHRGRAVARRVREVDRRLEARHQPAIRVGARIGEGRDRRRVMQDARDVVHRSLRHPGVAVAREQRRLALPDALMGVHAGAVVAENRLGHEGRRHPVAHRHVLDDVFVPGQPVGHLGQRLEAHVDFGLSGGRDFVMLLLDADADALHLEHHLGADVLQGVHRRDREVAGLVLDLEAEVRAVLDGALVPAVPVTFVRIDVVVARILRGVVAQRVEDEKLRLGSEVRRVADAGGLQIRLGLARDVARVARVVGAGDRIGDVGDDAQRRILGERIHHRSIRVGNHQHVAVVDRLPSANRRAVEAQPFVEGRFILELGNRGSEMLPRAEQVDEFHIDHHHALFLDHCQNLFRRHRTRNPPGRLTGRHICTCRSIDL